MRLLLGQGGRPLCTRLFTPRKHVNLQLSKSLKKESIMEQLVKVTRGGQITLPASLRRAAGIDVGDYVEVAVTEDGLVLKAKQVIDKAQAYFWSAEWQQAEREAQTDLDAGRSRRFDSVEDLIADLDGED
jgi:AbrB family looped-hinge helix DNA binding protein